MAYDNIMNSTKEKTPRFQDQENAETPLWLLDMDRSEAACKTSSGISSRLTASADWIRETEQGCILGFSPRQGLREELESYAAYLQSQYPGIRIWVEEINQELQLQLSGPPVFNQVFIDHVRYWKISALVRFNMAIRRFIRKLYRISTAPLRDLPDFMIIGAPRSGTTALYTQLARHPNVWPAANVANPRNRLEGKETHFFDISPHKGTWFYRAHFPLKFRRWRAQRDGSPFLAGEATPNYLGGPGVAEMVGKLLPEVRIIAMLRNPIDRAYSHYQMNRTIGVEPLSFEEAIDEETARFSVIPTRDTQTASYMRGYYSYLSYGLYADHLERWFEFFPRDQLLVIRSEDYFQNPVQVHDSVLKFLGLQNPSSPMVSGEPAPDLKGVVKNSISYDEIAPDTRKRLKEYFEPHNDRLCSLLGWEQGWE